MNKIMKLEYTAKIAGINRIGKDIVIINLKTSNPIKYKAGQYIHISLPYNNNILINPYSIASTPNDKDIEIHIRNTSYGLSNYFYNEASIGDVIKISKAQGEFIYHKTNNKIIALGGGTGIAPLKAIIKQAKIANHQNDIDIYFASRNIEDLYLHDYWKNFEKENLNINYIPITIEQSSYPEIKTGNIFDILIDRQKSFVNCDIYLSGPPAMIEDGFKILDNTDIELNNIYTESHYRKYAGKNAK